MENKKCPKCKILKNINQFYSKNGKISWCKSCTYETQKKRWQDRKIIAVNLLGGKCSKCGYNKNYAALDFHHVDPKEKEFDWRKCRQLSWENVLKELKKCICICKNCHSELHNPQSLIMQELPILTANNSLTKEPLKETGTCSVCSELVFGTKYCSKFCAAKARRVVKRPDKLKLKELINTLPLTHIGKLYNVSDNAVRKWIKFYDMSP